MFNWCVSFFYIDELSLPKKLLDIIFLEYKHAPIKVY